MDGAIVVLWQTDLKVRLTKIVNSPSRTALVRDPYARWCGRRGVEKRLPIPIVSEFNGIVRIYAQKPQGQEGPRNSNQ